MKNTYECMLLLDNREVRKGWEPLKDEVSRKLAKYGAEIVSARRWDERRLAYPISGQSRGTYLLVYYKSGPDANAGIKRELELSEPVLRHMITTCAEVPSEAYEPEAEFDPASIPTEDSPAQPASAAAAEAEAAEAEESSGETAKAGETATEEATEGQTETQTEKTTAAADADEEER